MDLLQTQLFNTDYLENKYMPNMEQWVKENVKNIESRDYQIEALNALQKRRGANRKRGLVHLATGLGKTSVAAVDVMHYLKEENTTGRVLFVSHMNEISLQAKNTFTFVDPSLTTAIFRGKMKDAQVTFSTFQALYVQLSAIESGYFDYIIYDEAHHIEAETFSAVRNHFRPKFELGLTATPERADGRDIFNYFGHPLFVKSLADGINDGWLSAIDYHIVFDEAIKKAMNDNFELKSLKDIRALFAIKSRNEIISQEVLLRRHEIGLDKAKTIVFCQNISAATEMAKLLEGEVYHSDITQEQRLKIMKKFKSGALQVICTVDMFNEGIDIPDARLVVFLRSTSSRTIFEQQLGRGLRRSEGKDKVTVLDFVANVERINFVRELGHQVAQKGSPRAGIGGHPAVESGEGSFGEAGQSLFTSNFEFEDQVIEILDRYDKIQAIEYLKTEEVIAEFEKSGSTVASVAHHFRVTENTIRKHLRKGGIVFTVKRLSNQEVVEYYNTTYSIQQTADYFDVSWQAVKKHLVKAGIDTSGHMSNGKSSADSEIIETYKKLGSITKTAKVMGIGMWIVKTRLERNGIKPNAPNETNYASQELIDAWNRLGSISKAAREVGLSKHQALTRMKNSGIDTAKVVKAKITKEQITEAYDNFNGDLLEIVEYFKPFFEIYESKSLKSRNNWVKVYRALDEYGFLTNITGPITSAVAAAAYYKYGNSVKAGEHLGVSGAFVSRKAKGAKYITKYKKVEA
jgi:superfamily II DNA or RNA helicase